MSETNKYAHLVRKYLNGNGVDIASGGWPVVPWAIQLELPAEKFRWYNQRELPETIELKGDACDLPFKDYTLDFVYSSHYIEDVFDWLPVLKEWTRCVKIGGFIVILLPDKALWNAAIAKGQPPNCEHRHESRPGELSEVFAQYFGHFHVVEDRLSNAHEGDYNIIFAARRVA